MSEEQVEIKDNTEDIKIVEKKESKKKLHHDRKEKHHEDKELKKKEKKDHKYEKKKEKKEDKIDKYEMKKEEISHHHHHHHHHHHDHHDKSNNQIKTKEVQVPVKTTTISEENVYVEKNNNVPLNSEWAGIISCDPSEIPEDISLSMSSVTPDQIPDDIALSMSDFDQGQSDNLKVKNQRNNLTESDLSPELELKDQKIIPGSQPNVGQQGAFESRYYPSSESKTEDKY